jgi:hypothetical protein
MITFRLFNPSIKLGKKHIYNTCQGSIDGEWTAHATSSMVLLRATLIRMVRYSGINMRAQVQQDENIFIAGLSTSTEKWLYVSRLIYSHAPIPLLFALCFLFKALLHILYIVSSYACTLRKLLCTTASIIQRTYAKLWYLHYGKMNFLLANFSCEKIGRSKFKRDSILQLFYRLFIVKLLIGIQKSCIMTWKMLKGIQLMHRLIRTHAIIRKLQK